MGWFKPSIKMNGDEVVLRRGLNRSSIRLKDIQSIHAEKIDKVTYEEVFIILEGSGELLSMGELDEGFDEFERKLVKRIRNFPNDWRKMIEITVPGVRTEIWHA